MEDYPKIEVSFNFVQGRFEKMERKFSAYFFNVFYIKFSYFGYEQTLFKAKKVEKKFLLFSSILCKNLGSLCNTFSFNVVLNVKVSKLHMVYHKDVITRRINCLGTSNLLF